MKLIAKLLVTALALLAVAKILPGVLVSGFYIAVIVAVILGALNLVVRPILIFLTLPINVITFGLFTLVINGFLFWFVSSFVDGFDVDSFWAAFVGAIIVSIFSYIGDKIIEQIHE